MRYIFCLAVLFCASLAIGQPELTPIPSPLVDPTSTVVTNYNMNIVAVQAMRVWRWDQRHIDGCTSFILTAINGSAYTQAQKTYYSQIVAIFGPVNAPMLWIKLPVAGRRLMVRAAASLCDVEGDRLIAKGQFIKAWATAFRDSATTVSQTVPIPRME